MDHCACGCLRAKWQDRAKALIRNFVDKHGYPECVFCDQENQNIYNSSCASCQKIIHTGMNVCPKCLAVLPYDQFPYLNWELNNCASHKPFPKLKFDEVKSRIQLLKQ